MSILVSAAKPPASPAPSSASASSPPVADDAHTPADAPPSASALDADASALDADASALDALRALALPHVTLACEAAARLAVNRDAEDFHVLRVSLRRLRSLLWAYEPVTGPQLRDAWADRLREVADIAGHTRDWDIVIDALLPAAHPPGKQRRAALHDALSACRDAASQESRDALMHTDVPGLLADFLRDVDEAAARPSASPTLRGLALARVADAARIVRRRARRALKGGSKDLRALHRTRIAVKKQRYILEFFEPVLDRHDKKRRKRLTGLQGHLGHLNDIVVARRLIDEEHLPGAAIRKPRKHLHRWLDRNTAVQAKASRKRLGPLLRAS